MPVVIDTPPRRPFRYGLLSSVTVRGFSDVHVGYDGFVFEGQSCDPNCILPIDCDSLGARPLKPEGEPGPIVGSCQFAVVGADSCFAEGPAASRMGKARALATLRRGESAAVEQFLALGPAALGGEPGEPVGCCPTECAHFQSPDTEVPTDECCTPAAALAELEAKLCECLGYAAGVIHVPAIALPFLSASNLLIRNGNRLETWLGNQVVVGCGYPGLSPEGEATDGCAWIYATGDLIVERGDPIELGNGRPDFETNTVTYRAERQYAIAADGCCVVGVPMKLCEV